LWVEKDDFRKESDPNYFRLSPGKEVRLQHAYYVTCTGFKIDDNGNVTEIYAEYDPATKGGWSLDGRKVKGTIHWVSAKHAIDVELRLYEHLFTKEDPEDVGECKDFTSNINPHSLIVKKAKGEPMLKTTQATHFQFLRVGYLER